MLVVKLKWMLGEVLGVWSGGGHIKPLEGKCVCGWEGLGECVWGGEVHC